MECYEKNLESIKNQEKYKKLYEYLCSQEELSEDGQEETDGISFGVSEVEGRPVLYAVKRKGEEEQIFQLDSLYDEAALIKLWCAGQKKIGSYQMKYIFCGLGSGLYVRAVLDRADDTAKILVYEPSAELFRFVLRNFDLSGLLSDERLTVVAEEYYERSFEDELYRVVTYSDLENLVYQAYPNYEQLYPVQLKETDHKIQIMYNSIRATQGVLNRYGRQYTENGLRNLKHFFEGRSMTDFYRKVEKDIPVIIVASGPSLDKNIEDLKEAAGKCLLVGLDSSVKALLRHNIIPNVFVSVDANKNMQNFADERICDIPVLCELNTRYELLDRIQEKKFFLNDLNSYVNRFFSSRGILFPVFTTGGSVANTACSIFTSMGFRTIIIVGQDLAYTGNRTHSKDTLRGAWNLEADKLTVTEQNGSILWKTSGQGGDKLASLEIEGYYGDKVRTSPDFELYLKWFEEEIRKNPDTVFINATEGGAMIHGAKNLSLKEAIEQYCIKEWNMTAILNSVDPLLDDRFRREFAQYVLDIVPKLEELERLARKGERHYGKMKELAYLNKYRSREWMRLFEECKEIGSRLEKEEVLIYVQNIIQQETSNISEHINDIKENTRDEIITTCRIGESYLHRMVEGIREVCDAEWMKEAREAAESRLAS